MKPRATIYAVAELASVSVATVSRVMRGLPGVSVQMQERVQKAMSELDYMPSGAAQGLASRRTGVIGLIFPDLDDPSGDSGHETLLYSDEVIRGAERAARGSGRAILIAATHRNADSSLVMSVASKVDGLVILARSLPEKELRLIAKQKPVVLLAGRRGAKGVDVLKADNEGGAYALTKHLIDLHHFRDLVFLSGPAESPDGNERLSGFQLALSDAQIEASSKNVVRGDFTESSGRKAVTNVVCRRGYLPQAIVAGNDQMAVGAMSALQDMGVDVPNEVAVTGFDDVQLSRYLQPTLTTVRQPMRELGELAIQLLVERLEKPGAANTSMILPTRLVLRQSCGCPGDASVLGAVVGGAPYLEVLKSEGR